MDKPVLKVKLCRFVALVLSEASANGDDHGIQLFYNEKKMFGCALGGNFCAANADFKQKLAHPTNSSNSLRK
jgi:hypothetical protein